MSVIRVSALVCDRCRLIVTASDDLPCEQARQLAAAQKGWTYAVGRGDRCRQCGGRTRGDASPADTRGWEGDVMEYRDFLVGKTQTTSDGGFEPMWMPDFLYDFQRHLVGWAIRKARAAILADCGLGKTPMQLVWAENIVRKTNRPVLILTPLAVTGQTLKEAEKFGISAVRAVAGDTSVKIHVTNYERLHHFDRDNFIGAVCDESSILKSFMGETRSAITEFMRKMPYRLLCTATAAPNDYIEMGTSSEALGYLGFMDVLSRFFKNNRNSSATNRVGNTSAQWRFRGHAEQPFWRWVCSWARSLRRPSDMGFDDGPFVLPALSEREHMVKAHKPRDGMLFSVPAVGLAEEREERRRTIRERCEMVAKIISDVPGPSVAWAHFNDEADLIEELIPGAIQVSGQDSDDEKEEKFNAFTTGEARIMVTKPIIGAWGMNWQHCAHMTTFGGHSFEQYYQSVRRFWCFGQTREVVVDHVLSDGEDRVLHNLKRKAAQAEKIFAEITKHIQGELDVAKRTFDQKEEMPSWL